MPQQPKKFFDWFNGLPDQETSDEEDEIVTKDETQTTKVKVKDLPIRIKNDPKPILSASLNASGNRIKNLPPSMEEQDAVTKTELNDQTNWKLIEW